MGLSASSWPLLQRLRKRSYVDQLALTPKAASMIAVPPKDLLVEPAFDILSKHWQKGGFFLVVGAVGAITRLVAPLLKNKEEDPAVLVLDSKAMFVVPLLGGHKAGAEDLAIQIAEDLGSQAVSTGDSESQGRLALDSFGEAWGWQRSGPSSSWRELMIQQAQGMQLSFEQKSGSTLWKTAEGAKKCLEGLKNKKIIETSKLKIGPSASNKCSWHPATLWIGIGCERNTSQSLIERALEDALQQSGLAEEAIAGIASIDIKVDEPALLSFAKLRGWPIRFFSSESLSKVLVPNPSQLVDAAIGTPSVAEAAALLAAGEGGCLSKPKSIYPSANNEYGALTIAIAEAVEPFAPKRGELHLIGSGPGHVAFLTNDARLALSRSVVWVGYSLYLDLLEPIRRHDQVRLEGQLTLERERCMQALNLASQGIRVALISSGDSGIYGMAGLALELLLEIPKDVRPNFNVHPGISAMQMAASRVGAPLMNDFCAVSLSDRLTPWPTIEERLLAALKGDFVIALYNPQSKSRDWQLKCTVELLLKHRPAKTPVVFARQLGRSEEKIEVYKLDKLPLKDVDMLTVLIVGNSRSFLKDRWVLTPRGYS